jgi:hypothetical protein
MHACPRCWEVIDDSMAFEGSVIYEEPAPLPPSGREQTVAIATPVVAPPEHADVQYSYSYPPAPVRSPTGIRFGRLVAIGLVAGLLLAIGLVAVEFFGPRLRGTLPDQVELERQTFDVGGESFGIGVPRDWEVRSEQLGSLSAVRVLEPATAGDSAGLREFQIVIDKRAITNARVRAARRVPATGIEIGIVDGLELDGRKAFRHMYTEDGKYREQWWIARGSGTYRLEFSAPESRREEAAILNVRIARSFDVL